MKTYKFVIEFYNENKEHSNSIRHYYVNADTFENALFKLKDYVKEDMSVNENFTLLSWKYVK